MLWSHCRGSWLNSLDNGYAESSRTASHQSDRGEVQETARMARGACPVAHEKKTSAKWDESDGCQPDRSARASGSIRAYHGCQTRCADCCGAFLLRAVVDIVRATGPESTYTQSRTSGHRGERHRLCPVAADLPGRCLLWTSMPLCGIVGCR